MRQAKVHTFSIAACDLERGEWGVAVASKFLAAAAVVSWAKVGGAVATQALANVTFGPRGLAMMETGASAAATLEQLLAEDPQREHRQVGMVDRQGNVAAHTGKACFAWAGHRMGKGYTCQGNILTGQKTVDAMAEAFENTQGELAERLLAALVAGDTVGGDSRGKQAAGVMVQKQNGGYGGDNDFYLDLRVDDDVDPVNRLAGMFKLHQLYFGKPKPEDLLPIDHALATELQTLLTKQGHYKGEIHGNWDAASKSAFWAFCGIENLEERWHPDEKSDFLDRIVIEFIRERFGA